MNNENRFVRIGHFAFRLQEVETVQIIPNPVQNSKHSHAVIIRGKIDKSMIDEHHLMYRADLTDQSFPFVGTLEKCEEVLQAFVDATKN